MLVPPLIPVARPVTYSLIWKKYPPASISLKTSNDEQLFFFPFGPLQNRTHTVHTRIHFLTLAAPINRTHTLEKSRSVPRSECLQFLLFLPTFVSHPFVLFSFPFPFGSVTIFSDFLRFFLCEEKWRLLAQVSRTSARSAVYVTSRSMWEEQLHRPSWVEKMSFSLSNCRFPQPCLVAAIIFPHTKWLPNVTDYRDTAALKNWRHFCF